ncbi:MAG: hypothetical protein ACLTS6_04530 [Anaerobutyricum sp.]
MRPKHSTGKTEDEPYFLNIDINKKKCNIHTNEWYLKKQEKKKKKQEDKLKKQQEQQNNNNITTPDDISNQIKKILNQ